MQPSESTTSLTDRFVQRNARGGVAGSGGRMRVADGVDIGAAAVNQQMHAQFGGRHCGGRRVCLPCRSVMTRSSGVIMPLLMAGGRGEDAARIEAHGNIAVGGGDDSRGRESSGRRCRCRAGVRLRFSGVRRDGFRVQNCLHCERATSRCLRGHGPEVLGIFDCRAPTKPVVYA